VDGEKTGLGGKGPDVEEGKKDGEGEKNGAENGLEAAAQ